MFFLLQFVLNFVNITYVCCTCKTRTDCVKTKQGETERRCCRDFANGSHLSCHDVSTCAERFCEADNDCDGQCCILNKCSKCKDVVGSLKSVECTENSDCDKDAVCCGKNRLSDHGRCQNNCTGSRCDSNDHCHSLEMCCASKTCVITGCEDEDEHENRTSHSKIVVVYLGLSGALLIFVILFLFLYKYALKPRRNEAAVSPQNLEMNTTVLTLPTSTHRTNSSEHNCKSSLSN